MIFVKHNLDFSQTSAHIFMKFEIRLFMSLSKVSQVCSNQVCMTFYHQIMLLGSCVSCIFIQCFPIHDFHFEKSPI